MVFLIGVDHLVQYNGPVPEELRMEFRLYLLNKCRELDITIIAEEFSEEALSEVYHATAETAKEAAEILCVKHRYCDPGEKELDELGIPYYVEALEQAKNEFNAPPSYIMNDELRKKVTLRAAAIAKSYWHLREQYWYDQICNNLNENILFICGYEHVDRFHALLNKHDHHNIIVDHFWKDTLFKDYANLNLM
jgi:hypothetical protein